MDTKELRERYLRFFESRDHVRIPSASLVPENDPSVLFTTAGMHPLAPYLMGEPHPSGKRLTNVQRCLRTNDIEEVGDASHLTFFEMLGNWSLGDYFKEESLAWSFEFLVRELGIDPERLAVTVFAGDADAPRDEESASAWRKLGISERRIYYLPKADNWWGPVGAVGPCGPDSEIFYDTGRPDHPGCRPGCPCGKWFEIWNNVFMQYRKTENGGYEKLEQHNVDTGMGVDRTAAVLQGNDDVFSIDTLQPLVSRLEQLSGREYTDNPLPFRVIADHVRAAGMAAADGVRPSNVEAGYVVRRLVRRAVRHAGVLGIEENFTGELAKMTFDLFEGVYPGLKQAKESAAEELDREETKFKRTLERGLGKYHKLVERLRGGSQPRISGEQAFDLFQTYGFPLSLTVEMAREQGLEVDETDFNRLYEEHKAISRQGSSQKFSGGLSDQNIETTRLHTATHLLHASLRRVLGEHVKQMGSNITPERLRFDFSHGEKMTQSELEQVKRLVNEQIEGDLEVDYEVMPLDAALESGALAFFGERYSDQVKVYRIGEFSREVCGGPHASRTGELGRFKILKEEAVGRGVRRIRAKLETG
jgi:alanyl-tRNA synthetase